MELQLEGLSKTYGTVQALRKVTYTFKPGIYGILGANGAGKSTMINLITDNVSRDSGSDVRLSVICHSSRDFMRIFHPKHF